MSETKHTPLKLAKDNAEFFKTILIEDAYGMPFALAKTHDGAKLILHAVNLHDDLVKALEEAESRGFDYDPDSEKDSQAYTQLVIKIRDLLHRAKEGQ